HDMDSSSPTSGRCGAGQESSPSRCCCFSFDEPAPRSALPGIKPGHRTDIVARRALSALLGCLERFHNLIEWIVIGHQIHPRDVFTLAAWYGIERGAGSPSRLYDVGAVER